MNKAWLIPLLLFVSIGQASEPTRDAIILGGSCEDIPFSNIPRPDNSFQRNFVSLSSGLKKHGWNVTPLFDGDNAKTSVDGRYDRRYPPTEISPYISPMTWSRDPIAEAAGLNPEDVRSATKKFSHSPEKKVKDLAPGSELLIAINAHGRPNVGKVTHQICLSDGPMEMNDSDFFAELKKLKDHGVRIGFTDSSCFSGASESELSPFGCAISSQAGNRVSYGDGVNEILALYLNDSSNAGKKKSLDDIFLASLALDLVLFNLRRRVKRIVPFQSSSLL